MEQKDKELLLKDLCARLPYGIKVQVEYDAEEFGKTIETDEITMIDKYGKEILLYHAGEYFSIEELKPYLRPMSSMTKEEKQMMDSLWKDNNKLVFADPDEVRRYRFYDISVVDFLNSRHFDYRGLIEKGLALVAPKGMYNIN